LVNSFIQISYIFQRLPLQMILYKIKITSEQFSEDL